MKHVKLELAGVCQSSDFESTYDIDTSHHIVTEQCLDIFMHLICKDLDDNPLNYAEQIDTLIVPNKNKNVQLKKERQGATDFLHVCALYHLEDSWNFWTRMNMQ